MDTLIKDVTDKEALKLEAKSEYSKESIRGFKSWITGFSLKDIIFICDYLQIGFHLGFFDNPFDLLKQLPEEVIYKKVVSDEIINHHFKLQINFDNGKIMLSYKHYLSEISDKDIGGMTDIWCNYFEGNKVTNYLIETEINNYNFNEKILEMYKFLIDNKIVN